MKRIQLALFLAISFVGVSILAAPSQMGPKGDFTIEEEAEPAALDQDAEANVIAVVVSTSDPSLKERLHKHPETTWVNPNPAVFRRSVLNWEAEM